MAHTATQIGPGDMDGQQRFRASLIASVAVHAGTVLALVVGPLFVGRTVVMPELLPVQLMAPPAAPAAAEQEPAAEEPPAAEPEPVEAVTSEPQPIPRSLEELRRQQREEQAAREAEEQRQREEQERKRREEEAARRRREEEERAKPQRATRSSATPTTQSARRQAIDITGTEEGQTSFTVEDFPFAAYLMRIRDMVAARWEPPPRGPYAPTLRGEVFFRIGRDGRLVVQPRILESSSNTLFDQAAMRAIASAAPFPPLPREYQGQSLGVRFAFIHDE